METAPVSRNCENEEIKYRAVRSHLSSGLVSKFNGSRGGCIGSCRGNRRERDHWGDLGVDGWIILGWISKRCDVGMWTGLGWPRIETGGGRLSVR